MISIHLPKVTLRNQVTLLEISFLVVFFFLNAVLQPEWVFQAQL